MRAERQSSHLSHISAFKVSSQAFLLVLHSRYLVGPSMPGLCLSLVDTESLHGAEGEPVAPLDYPCRSTTDESEQSGSKTGKDKKRGVC